MTATRTNDLDSLKQIVSSSSTENSDLVDTKKQLDSYFEAAKKNDRECEADIAKTLSQLFELAELSTSNDFSTGILQYIHCNISTLDDASSASQFVLDAQHRYRDYLDLEQDDFPDLTDHSDPWNSDETITLTETKSNEDDAEQMKLLLEALKTRPTDFDHPNDTAPTPLDDNPPRVNVTNATNNIQALQQEEDLREAFMDDASRCLESMEKCSLSIEQNPGNTEAISQFCRELHTLKGASASVGLAKTAAQIHETESALESNQSAEHGVSLMLDIVDKVRNVIEEIQPKRPATSRTTTQLNSRFETLSSADFNAGSSEDSLIRIRASKLDRLMDMLAELVVLRNRRESHHGEFAEFNTELNRCASRLNFFVQDPDSGAESMSSSCTLTELSKDVGVLASDLRELQKPINKDNLAISHFIRDFRHELMALRRIPLSGLFNRVQRSARDAAKTEGKQILLKTEGEDSGLERELQEKLFEPLLHVVRNAVSHGIETPQQRTNAGKNTAGLITLKAQSNSQMVVITIADDGKGLDYDAIRQRGIEKGLIGVNQNVSEHELGKLIFHPGFSTRQSASSVSGRGVGMDVVMNVLTQMRGRIEIESEPGAGTTMMITIPVQSGIEHVMVFRSGGQLFALPMQAVSKVKSNASKSGSSVNMATVLGLPHTADIDGNEVLMLRSPSSSGNKKSGFMVDEIVGPEEVVIRKLPPLLNSHPLFCGLTLSGAGETALLLDAARLSQFNQNIATVSTGDTPGTTDTQPKILVIDDSMSARKLLVKKLLNLGFHTTEAGDGVEAMEKIRNQKFDLVFTDLDMPRLGGMELLFDLKQGKHKDQAVVVVSSRDANEFKDRATELGAVGYIQKPVADSELNETLLHTGLIN